MATDILITPTPAHHHTLDKTSIEKGTPNTLPINDDYDYDNDVHDDDVHNDHKSTSSSSPQHNLLFETIDAQSIQDHTSVSSLSSAFSNSYTYYSVSSNSFPYPSDDPPPSTTHDPVAVDGTDDVEDEPTNVVPTDCELHTTTEGESTHAAVSYDVTMADHTSHFSWRQSYSELESEEFEGSRSRSGAFGNGRTGGGGGGGGGFAITRRRVFGNYGCSGVITGDDPYCVEDSTSESEQSEQAWYQRDDDDEEEEGGGGGRYGVSGYMHGYHEEEEGEDEDEDEEEYSDGSNDYKGEMEVYGVVGREYTEENNTGWTPTTVSESQSSYLYEFLSPKEETLPIPKPNPNDQLHPDHHDPLLRNPNNHNPDNDEPNNNNNHNTNHNDDHDDGGYENFLRDYYLLPHHQQQQRQIHEQYPTTTDEKTKADAKALVEDAMRTLNLSGSVFDSSDREDMSWIVPASVITADDPGDDDAHTDRNGDDGDDGRILRSPPPNIPYLEEDTYTNDVEGGINARTFMEESIRNLNLSSSILHNTFDTADDGRIMRIHDNNEEEGDAVTLAAVSLPSPSRCYQQLLSSSSQYRDDCRERSHSFDAMIRDVAVVESRARAMEEAVRNLEFGRFEIDGEDSDGGEPPPPPSSPPPPSPPPPSSSSPPPAPPSEFSLPGFIGGTSFEQPTLSHDQRSIALSVAQSMEQASLEFEQASMDMEREVRSFLRLTHGAVHDWIDGCASMSGLDDDDYDYTTVGKDVRKKFGSDGVVEKSDEIMFPCEQTDSYDTHNRQSCTHVDGNEHEHDSDAADHTTDTMDTANLADTEDVLDTDELAEMADTEASVVRRRRRRQQSSVRSYENGKRRLETMAVASSPSMEDVHSWRSKGLTRPPSPHGLHKLSVAVMKAFLLFGVIAIGAGIVMRRFLVLDVKEVQVMDQCFIELNFDR